MLTQRVCAPCAFLDVQHYTFYDLIVTKARGKSGPLFHFDVHDDVRIVNDSRIEKDEVSRSWLYVCFAESGRKLRANALTRG